MKYGLLTYDENPSTFNIGDYIQSLAAKQFLPKVDALINRERMASYAGDPTRIILNGWFTHNIHNWLPSQPIEPLFVSFHINSSAAPYLLDSKAVAYLKKHEPIGCRDKFTVQLLQEKGIEAYFSGCLTLTLSGYAADAGEKGDEVYIVDPLFSYPDHNLLTDWKRLARGVASGEILRLFDRAKHLKKMIAPELLRNARYETQVLPAGKYSDREKFDMAEALLRKYARAKLVITSRIHCALPCLAMGTPVIFINGFGSFIDTCRFDGILDLFNRIDIDGKGNFSANFGLEGRIGMATTVTNFEHHKVIAGDLAATCRHFIAGSSLSSRARC